MMAVKNEIVKKKGVKKKPKTKCLVCGADEVCDNHITEHKKLSIKAQRQKRSRLKKKKDKADGFKTEKDLWGVFSKLVKMVYPSICHGHASHLEIPDGPDKHACHFVKAQKEKTRYDLRNVLPGCRACNGFDQSHVYKLGKWIERYWGAFEPDGLRLVSEDKLVFSKELVTELYHYFNEWLSKRPCMEDRFSILDGYLSILDGSKKKAEMTLYT